MEAEMQESALMFYYKSLGLQYLVLLPMAALIGFLLTLLLVWKGRGWYLIPGLMLAVSWPLLVGVYGVFDGITESIQVLIYSTTTPHPSALAQGYSMSLVTAKVGMILMLPAYFMAIVGMVVRSTLTKQTTA